MADQIVHEMVSAFAAGCMDPDNYAQFKDYLSQGGELPDRELGELQNIVSMIPVILELEQPDAGIKDMVAKKLIGMKEEIKAKLISTKKTNSTFGTAHGISKTGLTPPTRPKMTTLTFASRTTKPVTSPVKSMEEELKKSAELPKSFTETMPPAPPKTSATHPERLEAIRSIDEKAHEPELTQTKPTVRQTPLIETTFDAEKSASSGVAGWIAIMLTIILFMLLGYYTYSSIDSLRKKVDDLSADVTQLKSSIVTANKFVANYNALVEFFNYKDIAMFDLAGSDAAEKGSARLMLSFAEKEGLMQFRNAKALQPNQSYQVWMMSKGQAYSLGAYQPAGSEFIRITSFPFLPKEQISGYEVTVELNGGSATPSSNIYLTSGGAQRTPARGRVK